MTTRYTYANRGIKIDTVPPTATDDVADGYQEGCLWIDENLKRVYMLLDETVGAAVWVAFPRSKAGTVVVTDGIPVPVVLSTPLAGGSVKVFLSMEDDNPGAKPHTLRPSSISTAGFTINLNGSPPDPGAPHVWTVNWVVTDAENL